MNIFGNLGMSTLVMIIPGALQSLGMSFKNKDDNATGFDDAGGNVLIAIGPVIPAFLTGNQSIIKKTLTAVRDAIDAYLKASPPSANG